MAPVIFKGVLMKKIQYILPVLAAAAMLTACNNEQPAENGGSTSETSTALAVQSDSDIQQAEGTSAAVAEESADDTSLAETSAAESIAAAQDTTSAADNTTSETAKAASETTAAETTTTAPETTARTADMTELQDNEELPVLMLDDPIVSEQEETTKAPAHTVPSTQNIPAVTTTVSSKTETTTAANTTTADKPIELPFVPAV